MKLFDAFLDLVYPPRCIICNSVTYHPGCCESCEGKLERIEGERCFTCGHDIKNCQCKRSVFHFDGVTAPFYNKGFAKQAVYSLKFGEKFSCLDPISEAMADAAIKTFGKENIDFVCFVPASKRTLRNRGFNQCELFAKRISKRTGIPLNSYILGKNDNVATQHELKTVDERFRNIRGAYYATERIKGKRVLLVDDIKTSGASLDECARQLKFAGAESVYCVTALMTTYDKDKKQK